MAFQDVVDVKKFALGDLGASPFSKSPFSFCGDPRNGTTNNSTSSVLEGGMVVEDSMEDSEWSTGSVWTVEKDVCFFVEFNLRCGDVWVVVVVVEVYSFDSHARRISLS